MPRKYRENKRKWKFTKPTKCGCKVSVLISFYIHLLSGAEKRDYENDMSCAILQEKEP